MGPFFYFNRSRFMKGVWGISRGSFNLYLDWQKKSDVTNNSRLYDIIIEEWKNYIVDNKGVYFRKSFKKNKKKNPWFQNVLFNLFSMFSIQVLSRRAKKGKWPPLHEEVIPFMYTTACYKKKSTEKNRKHSSNDNNWRLDLWLYVPTKHLLSVLQCS